jgi:hypothetical protein
MMIRRYASLAVLSLGTLAACASDARGPEPPAGWQPVITHAGLTVALDTVRIAATDSGHAVWMRSDYTDPQHLPDQPDKQYLGMEAHVEVNCGARRGRVRRIIVLGVGREPIADHAYDRPWQDFDAAPLSPSIMEPLCRALRDRLASRGAV